MFAYLKTKHIWIVLIFSITFWNCSQTKQGSPVPPDVEKKPEKLTANGDTRIDNYYWLNQRENPQVIEYLVAENNYTDVVLAHTKTLQNTLFDEMVGRIKQDDQSVPYQYNGYYYYNRYETGKEYPVYARKKGSLDAAEEILLDVNEMAEGHDYYQLTGLEVSPDNQLIAFGVDTVSRRQYTLHIKNLATGEILADRVPNTTGTSTWANDNRTLFYATKDSTLRPYKIMRHTLGSDPASDVEVFHEADNTYDCYVYKSKSEQYIFIASSSTLSSEFRFLDATNPNGEFKIIQPRERDHEYEVFNYQDKFYILTNLNAKNFRLMETSVRNTGKENWTEVIPHRDDILLETIEVFNNYLVLRERKNGLRQLRIINQRDKSDHYLDFGEPAYSIYSDINLDFDTDLLRYKYTSLTTPMSNYEYNMKTREKNLLKQDEVLGGFDPANYVTERLEATARDGVKVPLSIVYRKGVEKNGENPLLLYGYGSYGISMDATFRSDRLSLLDRGFVFAIAHIRGGQEMGRSWYEDGKLLKKKNTFSDFIDCGEFLIEQKYTNREKIFALGGSAGGLLIGAVVNMRPDLFKGVIAAVPFVDVITTMLDESIPLTTGEFDEWGNPKDPVYYEYMKSYSPYDNVEAKDYPAMLVTTGLHDSQVQYFEPAKWVAKLRDLKTDDNPLLMHTQMEAGHSGASGRFEKYRTVALEYAFLIDLANADQSAK
ncbi:MAG: S9 family peptidase [Calditrichia bacterium]